MAEILFGSPSVRLNINKVWRKFHNPDVFFETSKQKKNYIYTVKNDLELEKYFRHSIRKMSNAELQFWKHPVWIIRPVRSPVLASPNILPLEFVRTDRMQQEVMNIHIDKMLAEKGWKLPKDFD